MKHRREGWLWLVRPRRNTCSSSSCERQRCAASKVPHGMEVPLCRRARPRFLAPTIPTTRVRPTGRLTRRAHAGRASGRRGFNGWHIMSHFRSRGARMNPSPSDKICAALETFRIELPSWGFANTGTRFGKFIQPAAATATEEKFSDAAQVHLFTGVCPTLALHVLWDCPEGVQSTDEIMRSASRCRIAPGSVNPNPFQDQEYKYGSFGNPDDSVRRRALLHTKDSIEMAKGLPSRDISLWFARSRP